MELDIYECKVYVISPGTDQYEHRLNTVMNRLQDAGFKDVEHIKSVEDGNKTNSLSLTNAAIFDKEANGTKPFIILEDDVQINTLPTGPIHVPKDASALYLGVGWWIYPFEYHTLGCGFDIRKMIDCDAISYDKNLVQIGGMTDAHAILYIDRKFTNTTALCIRSHIEIETAHDLILATLQCYYKVYALKKIMFYQDKQLGGQENTTKLAWDEEKKLFDVQFNVEYELKDGLYMVKNC